MPKRIVYTDDQLREAIATSQTWPEVMKKIGRHGKTTSARLRPHIEQLGIDCSHIGGKSSMDLSPSRTVPLPFGERTFGPRTLQVQALARAMNWFMQRGYPVSLPVEPVPYDLIADSDEGLKKVQVKSSQRASTAGRFEVKLHRSEYVPATNGNPGRYRQVAYKEGEADLFFVCCRDGSCYLLPFQVIEGRHVIVITAKYASYRVE